MKRKNSAQPEVLTLADKATAAVLAAMPSMPREPAYEVIETHPLSAQDVAKRSIVLAAVIAANRGISALKLKQWLQREGLWGSVSPAEAAVLNRVGPSRPPEEARFECEALLTLLWALRKTDRPSHMAGRRIKVEPSALPPLFAPTAQFITTAQLRDADCLLEAAGLIWQIHWMVVDAAINHRDIPGGTEEELIEARHHAMNWLINDSGEDWDDVRIDT